MGKLVITAVAAAVSLAFTAAYAETPKAQEQIKLAQTDTTKDTTKERTKRTKPAETKNVDEANPAGGPSEGKQRRASGKQRKSGPDAKGVDEANPAGGPTEGKARTPSGKQRKSGPDAKSVDENRPSK